MSSKHRFMRQTRLSFATLLGAVLLSWGALPNNVTYVDAFEGKAKFGSPVFMAEYPNKPGFFVVLEQARGNVLVVHKDNGNWIKDTLFHVNVQQNDEMGMLGFAFHPKFAENKKYYVSYNPTGNYQSIVEERLTDATFIKDSGSPAKTLFQFDQPFWNHDGGTIGFNAKDGYLYVGFGDGGDGGDPKKNGQNKNTLFGKILRVDVNKAENGNNYGIPADNPFVGETGTKPEIWAYGLRNPWKWSFDPLHPDTLWVGDVGQNAYEEVDVVPKGGNMGWNTMEGTHCYGNTAETCNKTGLVLPILDYKIAAAQCVIGGHVFRANPASPFYGAYFYADYTNGEMHAITLAGGKVGENLKMTTFVNQHPTSFATDNAGSLYVLTREGIIYRLESPDLRPSGTNLEKLRKQKGLQKSFHKNSQGWKVRDGFGEGTQAMQIYDTSGHLMQSFSAVDLATEKEITLAPGMYFAKMLRGQEWVSQTVSLF